MHSEIGKNKYKLERYVMMQSELGENNEKLTLRTDAGCNRGLALLISWCTSVACESYNTVLARALTSGCVTRPSKSSHGVAVAR